MSTFVSVNSGLPRHVLWRDRAVHTDIVKASIRGPVMVPRNNFDGECHDDRRGRGGRGRPSHA